jgi:ribosomal protein S5
VMDDPVGAHRLSEADKAAQEVLERGNGLLVAVELLLERTIAHQLPGCDGMGAVRIDPGYTGSRIEMDRPSA